MEEGSGNTSGTKREYIEIIMEEEGSGNTIVAHRALRATYYPLSSEY